MQCGSLAAVALESPLALALSGNFHRSPDDCLAAITLVLGVTVFQFILIVSTQFSPPFLTIIGSRVFMRKRSAVVDHHSRGRST